MLKKESINNFIIYFVIFGAIFPLFFILFGFSPTAAQTVGGSDAIAVRIIPNPNHYSVYRWYDSQGFKGSPQALIVDGYEAVRDGRTVYVNAANVKNKSIYTNIYLISYNQDPSPKTVDILGQIVKNWKFNGDLVESTNPGPSCAISSLSCLSNNDCATNQECATSTIASSSCQLKTVKNCLTDNDCPQNFFCNSIKAKIIRDLKRIGKTEEIKEALYDYKIANGSYPKLTSGSYLANHTLSVWPSWSDTFLPAISMTSSSIDPINRLGACSGYDVKTCWNKDTKRFVYNPTPNYLMLPAGSYGLVYQTDQNGSDYSLCAVMETRENTPELNFQFEPNNPNSSDCVTATGIISGGTATNTPPYIIDSYLIGSADEELNASVKVTDDQGNPLTWNLNTSAGNWSTWSGAPVLKNTNNPNQKKIYALKAGAPGTYNTTLTVSDGQANGTLATVTPLVIINPKPFIESDNGEYALNATTPFSYSFYFSDNNLATPVNNTTYSVTKLSGPNNFDLLSLNKTLTPAGLNRYQVTYQGNIPPNNFSSDADYVYRITVHDKYNAVTTKDFKITIKAETPTINFNCPTGQRLGRYYSCLLGYVQQGNQQLTYTSNNVLPQGLTINIVQTNQQNQNNNNPTAFLPRFFNKILSLALPTKTAEAVVPLIDSVYLSGTTTDIFSGEVSIKVTNNYGASSTKSFPLSINNYCGDAHRQDPNGEARGGFYNDGYEDCDRGDGVTLSVANSNIRLQYGCSTIPSDPPTPLPIPNNSYCVYKSPLENGGYCGDGYCQVTITLPNGTELPMENWQNCGQDCLCTPQCENKCIGDPDNCGHTCTEENTPTSVCLRNETKPCSSTYNQGLPSYCQGIEIQGTQTCNNTCTGWNDCVALPPTPVANSSSGCNSTNPTMDGFSCCELIYCVHDACGCCGRNPGDANYIDLIAAMTNSGYTVKKAVGPDGGTCTTNHNTSNPPVPCTCGTAGCHSPECNSNNNSCVLGQSASTPTNWSIQTNHTSAYYQCWQ